MAFWSLRKVVEDFGVGKEIAKIQKKLKSPEKKEVESALIGASQLLSSTDNQLSPAQQEEIAQLMSDAAIKNPNEACTWIADSMTSTFNRDTYKKLSAVAQEILIGTVSQAAACGHSSYPTAVTNLLKKVSGDLSPEHKKMLLDSFQARFNVSPENAVDEARIVLSDYHSNLSAEQQAGLVNLICKQAEMSGNISTIDRIFYGQNGSGPQNIAPVNRMTLINCIDKTLDKNPAQSLGFISTAFYHFNNFMPDDERFALLKILQRGVEKDAKSAAECAVHLLHHQYTLTPDVHGILCDVLKDSLEKAPVKTLDGIKQILLKPQPLAATETTKLTAIFQTAFQSADQATRLAAAEETVAVMRGQFDFYTQGNLDRTLTLEPVAKELTAAFRKAVDAKQVSPEEFSIPTKNFLSFTKGMVSKLGDIAP